MIKADLGTKRVCPSCGARFYDLQKRPIECPKCAFAFEPEVLLRQRRPRTLEPAQAPVVKEAAEDDADEELEDAEEEELDEVEDEAEDEEVDVVDDEEDDTAAEDTAAGMSVEDPDEDEEEFEDDIDDDLDDDDEDAGLLEEVDEDEDDVSGIIDADLDKEES